LKGETNLEKHLFSNQKLPILLTSISDSSPGKAIATFRNAIYDGTDGFLIHLEKMEQKFINEDSLTHLFNYACDKPLYTMNYRMVNSKKTDDMLMDEQFMAIRSGASMIDMMGDMFDPAPRQLTFSEKAVSKQKQTIEEIHEMGAEVLMSSHTWVNMTTEEVLSHTKELESRGADFIKIAMAVNSEEEAIDAMKTTSVVSKALSVPFLHICMGQYGKLHRAIGPMLGSCFALCVQSYTEAGQKEKPLLRSEKAVFDNIDRSLARRPEIGTKEYMIPKNEALH
jgi:hypothetical protein